MEEKAVVVVTAKATTTKVAAHQLVAFPLFNFYFPLSATGRLLQHAAVDRRPPSDGSIAGSIQNEDWANVRNVTKFPEIFYEITLKVSELLGEEKGKIVNNEVDVYLKKLFVIYVSKYAKGSKNQSSAFDSSNSFTCGHSQNAETNSLSTKFYMKKQKEDSGSLCVKSELDSYLEDQEPESEDFDILIWWKVDSPRFSIFSQLARDVLANSMSSVTSEYAFSTGDCILDPFKRSLTPKCVQCLICVQD
ncbi:hypothetical protein KY290_001846 [Solanum tuberosum]|uniref:HAT C-terminal dimerisation domain-containing protein n=1 Tax=Solanum tuberosum TaxID=4113 RepID=A0ABQ7WQB0_SOLTU|nr:hypothetical protein KY290_001846 [Solanum tuberosum]